MSNESDKRHDNDEDDEMNDNDSLLEFIKSDGESSSEAETSDKDQNDDSMKCEFKRSILKADQLQFQVKKNPFKWSERVKAKRKQVKTEDLQQFNLSQITQQLLVLFF